MTRLRPVLLDALVLDRSDPQGLARQVHAGVRAMVLDGVLPAGARLPSSRALADAWGIARNTVVGALDIAVTVNVLPETRASTAGSADSTDQAAGNDRPSSSTRLSCADCVRT